MASIPSNMFTCNGGYCTDATMVLHHDQAVTEPDKLVIPMSADVTCYYLIRGGIRLGDGVSEQDVIDVLGEQGYRAMWVDSESDARAQAMEFE